MKNFIILMALLLTMTTGYGQFNVYHPFPTTNAFWGDDGWNIFDGGICLNTRFGLNGDTLIGENVYTKVYSLYDSTLTNPYSSYYAAIREDNKRIYAIVENSGEEVLYDFNLSVGDTLFHHYSLTMHSPREFYKVVTSIDSIQLLNGEYRKYFDFGETATPDRVIEGIGSISWTGLFNPLESDIALDGDQYRFECFKQDETILYLDNPDCDHCFCSILTSIAEVEAPEVLTISPNPFSIQTTIQTDKNLSDATLTVYNLFGQELQQRTHISGKSFAIKRGNLTDGLYLLRINENNKTIATGKIIVKD